MSPRARFRFRLFVADGAPNSALATGNLQAFCLRYLPQRHEIEVVDVFKASQRALADRVLMTPTLFKLAPLPVLRIVGTLNDTQTLLHALGLAVGVA